MYLLRYSFKTKEHAEALHALTVNAWIIVALQQLSKLPWTAWFVQDSTLRGNVVFFPLHCCTLVWSGRV